MSEADRRRVADALKTKGRRPTPAPEPEDVDPLLDATPGDAADDAALWKNDPHTRRQCLRFRQKDYARRAARC